MKENFYFLQILVSLTISKHLCLIQMFIKYFFDQDRECVKQEEKDMIPEASDLEEKHTPVIIS